VNRAVDFGMDHSMRGDSIFIQHIVELLQCNVNRKDIKI